MRRSKFQIFLLVSKALSGKTGPWIRYVFAFCATLSSCDQTTIGHLHDGVILLFITLLMIGESKACDNNIIPGDSMS